MLILAHWSISLVICVLYMFFLASNFVKASDLYYLLTDLLDNMKRTEGQVSWFSGSTARVSNRADCICLQTNAG